jgi:hypothetical protein
MTQVDYGKKLKGYIKKSFISFFREGIAKNAKRNKEWTVNISDDTRFYGQFDSCFDNNYPCMLLIDFEGSKNRKYYLKDLHFAVLVAVDGVNRIAYYVYSDWNVMY